MRSREKLAVALAIGVLLGGGAFVSHAASLNGVTLPDTATVGGKPVKLNGMGVRKKFFVSVYVAGLYLETPTRDGAAATATDEPKRVVMVFQHDVTHDQLIDAWKDGFAATDPAGTVASQVQQFLGYFGRDFKVGDQITFDYAPGTGTTTTVVGEAKPAIPGVEFMRALFGIWLGKSPPTQDLKAGMLGAG